MIRPARKRLWRYNHGNTRVNPGSLSSIVLESLYPDNKKTMKELCGTLGDSVKMTLNRLGKRNFVICNQDGTYALSDHGRWFAISSILGISFLELCLLASACCTHERFTSARKDGFYMRSTFEGILRQYYSRHYIACLFSSLKRKGFAVRFAKGFIQIPPKRVHHLLSRYRQDFKRLEAWLDNLEEREIEIFSEALEGFELKGDHE